MGVGMKLGYAIDRLGTSAGINNFTVHFGDAHLDYFSTKRPKNNQRTSVVEFSDSTGRMAENQNVESIRKTMQMHEDIFKHQVRELHRLYSVQKTLTNELKEETRQNKGSTPTSSSDVNVFRLIDQHNSVTKTNLHFQGLIDKPTSRERSDNCVGDTLRVLRGFDVKRPAEEDVSTRVMVPKSNKMNISSCDSEVELTLSIGGTSSSSSSKKSRDFLAHHSLQLGSFESATPKEIREPDSTSLFKFDRGEDCSTPTTPMSSSSATVDRERKQRHWLFRGLSINRT
ncbi:hypothetical protein HS088_TW23G00691 [Tripterygium wilfordii]|uniref:Uncharacterized protein n=1 Tax=Tripterygium wilfordii TaxID=458696 RepID=A0A7J7BVW0_TRIWF|nr:uncharacterized protein LOC119993746 [Tripterygium wilfordii]KAF5725958.1 hypothetical protein HS088_TW23G00691 [Tripterygium wilfordii]